MDQVFETYWPLFEYRFSATLKETISAESAKPRDKEDILGEILENTRLTSLRVRKLEAEIDRSRKLTSLAAGSPLGLLHDAVYQGMKAGVSREAMMGKLKGEFFESESMERAASRGVV